MNEHEDNDAEEQLAKRLEQLHQALLDSRRTSADETPNSPVDLSRGDVVLQPAADLLRLLEQIKPSESNPIGHESGATLADGHSNGEFDSLAGSEFELSDRLSRFEIIEPLGQGGYGTVYLARDKNLNRNVALKFPRPEVLTRPSLKRRFIHEARAASTLSHPNIVTVYEAGKDGGLYFIACEYVRGMTLDEYLLDLQQPLQPMEAAEIVAVLAGAISHAHDHGVVHRDLKPANILIELKEDATDEPSTELVRSSSLAARLRICDFGLSKTIDSDNHETRTGAVVGTPAYMAPEQTRGDAEKIGPSADIYALGTILYRLLTGKIPFDHETVLKTIRAVQEQEPTAPSRINSQVPRDLESICLKCLEKKPERRYATAFDLADDLRKFRGGFPVQARPVTQIDRMARWVKRNPALATVGSLAALLMLVALTAASIGWSSTNKALAREKIANLQSEQRYNDFKQAVDIYFAKVCDNPRFKRLPQTEPVRQELLQLALNYYQGFAKENQDDPGLRVQVAQTNMQIGEIFSELGIPSDALPQFEMALVQLADLSTIESGGIEVLESKARALNGAALAQVNLGDTNKAIQLNDEAVEIQLTVVQSKEGSADARRQLAKYLSRRGFILVQSNDYEDALISWMRVVDLCRELAEENPDDTELELQELDASHQVGNALHRLGKVVESEKEIDRLVIRVKDLIHREPTLWAASKSLAESLARKAQYRLMEGDSEQAERLLLEALPLTETLCLVHPKQANYYKLRIRVVQDLANSYMIGRRLVEQARPWFEEAMRNSQKQLELDAEATDSIMDLAVCTLNYGSFLADSGTDSDVVETQFRNSRELWKQLQGLSRDQMQTQHGLASCAINLSRIVWESRHNGNDSLLLADDAVAILERLESEFPDNPRTRYYAFSAYHQRAIVLRELDRFEDSVRDFRKGLERAPPPLILEVQADLALSLIKNGDLDEAILLFDVVESAIEKAPSQQLDKLPIRSAHCYALLAARANSDSDEEQFLATSGKAIARIQQALAAGLTPEEANLKSNSDWDALRELPEFIRLVAQPTPISNASESSK